MTPIIEDSDDGLCTPTRRATPVGGVLNTITRKERSVPLRVGAEVQEVLPGQGLWVTHGRQLAWERLTTEIHC